MTGYRILADLTWYDSDWDKDSVIARPYNVDQLFEYDSYKVASKFQLYLYDLLFPYFPTKEDMENSYCVNLSHFNLPKPPCYLKDYYYFDDKIVEENLYKYFRLKQAEEILDDANLELYNKIRECDNSVGVHVRRGDMASEGGFWKVVPPDYFINVCNIPELQEWTFFFFSEEPEWIRENILPYINVKYELANNNSSYYGYRDLYLLSNCKYQVSSQGSFGPYAYIMNKYQGKRLIVYKEEEKDMWEWHL